MSNKKLLDEVKSLMTQMSVDDLFALGSHLSVVLAGCVLPAKKRLSGWKIDESLSNKRWYLLDVSINSDKLHSFNLEDLAYAMIHINVSDAGEVEFCASVLRDGVGGVWRDKVTRGTLESAMHYCNLFLKEDGWELSDE